MIFKKTRPTTPSQRHITTLNYKSLLTNNKPFKPLLVSSLQRAKGRNFQGRITMWHRGGGHKKLYRVIDFKRNQDLYKCKVETIEYDPNRSCFISLVLYDNGQRKYIISPHNIKVGDVLRSGDSVPHTIGNSMPINKIIVGTPIHLIEMRPGQGGVLVRSAGGYATVYNHQAKYTLVKLRSGEIRKILPSCRATIGQISNISHHLRNLGKAGASRWRGTRPTVRGVAMNSVDHPHGGGEAKGKNHHPQDAWGNLSKGKKTRNNKRTDQFIVSRRR